MMCTERQQEYGLSVNISVIARASLHQNLLRMARVN